MRTSNQPEVHTKSHLGSPAFHLHASQTAGLLGAPQKRNKVSQKNVVGRLFIVGTTVIMKV
jgi:hypothetical protein